MAQTRNTDDELVQDRRINGSDRRMNGERRNLERLILMKSDCRSGVPRRMSDTGVTMVDTDMWWSNNQQFY